MEWTAFVVDMSGEWLLGRTLCKPFIFRDGFYIVFCSRKFRLCWSGTKHWLIPLITLTGINFLLYLSIYFYLFIYLILTNTDRKFADIII